MLKIIEYIQRNTENKSFKRWQSVDLYSILVFGYRFGGHRKHMKKLFPINNLFRMQPYLSCPLCLKNTLGDVQELQKYIASSLSRSHYCPICSASLKGLSSLHFHLKTHFPLTLELSVNGLSGSPEHIPSLEKLEIRDDSNSPSSKVEIPQNLRKENVERDCEESERNLNSVQSNCEFCGLVFSSEYFLTLHKDIMHSDINQFEVECKQCKSRFKDLEAYRIHVKEIHSDRRYICNQCPKSFKIKGGLLVHTKMFHDQSSPSTCQVCKKNFTSKARKELHEKRYHDKKNQMKTINSQRTTINESEIIEMAKSNLEHLIQETGSMKTLVSTNSQSAVSMYQQSSPLVPFSKVQNLQATHSKNISITGNNLPSSNLMKPVNDPKISKCSLGEKIKESVEIYTTKDFYSQANEICTSTSNNIIYSNREHVNSRTRKISKEGKFSKSSINVWEDMDITDCEAMNDNHGSYYTTQQREYAQTQESQHHLQLIDHSIKNTQSFVHSFQRYPLKGLDEQNQQIKQQQLHQQPQNQQKESCDATSNGEIESKSFQYLIDCVNLEAHAEPHQNHLQEGQFHQQQPLGTTTVSSTKLPTSPTNTI
ncbi:hypothetical protein Avbf_07772 [Armadillidium vulgare]|nr:hypothetical protein Avbf_07772 [Armadillidium vulgare]